VHHLLGFKFRNDQLTIKPALYEETVPLTADLRYRDGRIKLEIRGKGNVESALINGQKLSPDPNGLIVLPEDFKSGTIIINTDDQK
jgi:cellobiose phosphorylase